MREPQRITNRFGTVAYSVMSDPGLTMKEKALYGYLTTFVGNDNICCWPGIKKMAAELNASVSTIKRLVKSLKQKQIIVRERRGGGKTYLTYLLK